MEKEERREGRERDQEMGESAEERGSGEKTSRGISLFGGEESDDAALRAGGEKQQSGNESVIALSLGGERE